MLFSTLKWMLVLLFSAVCFAQESEDLESFSIEDLLDIEINSASKYDQKVNQAPASITIITAEDIERYGYETLDEVFNSLRGFYVSNDKNYSYLGARGFGRPTDYNNRILFLTNGHFQNESVYNSVLMGAENAYNMNEFERIEIVRGPGSALYGASAMFAVVNFVTRSGKDIDGLTINSKVGSYNNRIGSLLFGKQMNNGIDVKLSAKIDKKDGQDYYFPEYDDPATFSGKVNGMDWEDVYRVMFSASYKNLKINSAFSSRNKGIPTGAWETVFNDRNAETTDEKAYVELSYKLDLSPKLDLNLRTFVNHYYYTGNYSYEDVDENDEPYTYLTTDESTGRIAGFQSQFTWDVKSSDRVIFGFEYQNSFDAEFKYWDEFGEYYFDGNFPYSTSSVFAQSEHQFSKKLSAIVSARGDFYTDYENSFSPRAALIYSPYSATTFKALFGKAYRKPSIYEAFYEDELSSFKANPRLASEEIQTLELVAEHKIRNNLFGAVSLFNNRISNLIDQVIDPSDSLLQFQNSDKINSTGAELELQLRNKNGLHGYANYSYQYTRNKRSNSRLTNSPEHLVKFGASYPIHHLFYLSTEMRYESERLTVYDSKTDGFFISDLNISSKLLFGHLKLAFKINNLFDKNYALPGGFEHIQWAIPQNERTFILSTRFSL